MLKTIDDVSGYEIEITSDCNAACPLCARTERKYKHFGNESITLAEFKQIFSDPKTISGKAFDFCGVFGDPIVHPEFLDICKFVSDNGASRITISTNGGYNTIEWWKQLAKIPCLAVEFCIDGYEETNHLYRRNVVWNVVKRNLDAFVAEGGEAIWIYIPFAHNEHEIEIAKAYADRLNIKFKLRKSGRNLVNEGKTYAVKHKKQSDNITIKRSTVDKDRSVSELKKIKNTTNDNKEFLHEKSKTISCKHLNWKQLFIGADKRLYPCCYIYDYSQLIRNRDDLPNKFFRDNEPDWNNLLKHSVESILRTDSFVKLADAWSPYNEYFIRHCLNSCGDNASSRNISETVNKK